MRIYTGEMPYSCDSDCCGKSNHLVRIHTWLDTFVFIHEKNHIHATIVDYHLLTFQAWLNTCVFIQEKNHIHASTVGNNFPAIHTSLITCVLIQEENHIHASSVGNQNTESSIKLFMQDDSTHAYSCKIENLFMRLLWKNTVILQP